MLIFVFHMLLKGEIITGRKSFKISVSSSEMSRLSLLLMVLLSPPVRNDSIAEINRGSISMTHEYGKGDNKIVHKKVGFGMERENSSQVSSEASAT